MRFRNKKVWAIAAILIPILLYSFGYFFYSTDVVHAAGPNDLCVIPLDDRNDNHKASIGKFKLEFVNRATIKVSFVGTGQCKSPSDQDVRFINANVKFQDVIGGYYIDSDTGDGRYRYELKNGKSGDDSTIDQFSSDLDSDSKTGDPFNGQDKQMKVLEILNSMNNIEYIMGIEEDLIPTASCPDKNSNFIFRRIDGDFKWSCGSIISDSATGIKVRSELDVASIGNFNIVYNFKGGKIVHVSPGERSSRTFSWCPSRGGGQYRTEECNGDLFIQAKEADLAAIGSGSQTFVMEKDGTSDKFEIKVAGAESSSATTITDDQDSVTEAEATCESKGGPLGWILCNVVTSIYDSLRDLYQKVVIKLLESQPLPQDGSSSTIRDVWSSIRTLANVSFIIIFLIFVFGQSTSIGIDAYTAKKMLPRLVIGVILVQLSYFIVSLMVDFTNVLGGGLGSLVLTPISDSTATFSFNDSAFNFALIIAGIGSAVAVGTGLMAITPILLAALLVVISVVITLVFRHLVIVMLVILSPLAFVLWILPNTENYFKMWWSTLFKVLLMYPIIVMLISSGMVAGELAGASSEINDSSPELFDTILTILAAFAPLALIPATFKFAGGAIAAISGAVSNRGAGLLQRNKERAMQKSALNRRNFSQGSRFSETSRAGRAFNKVGRQIGAGARGRFGFGERGKQAIALRDGSAVEETLKSNAKLQQLAFNDEANAIMALSGGDTKRAAVVANKLAAENGWSEEQKNSHLQAASAVGFSRQNATAALTTLAQNKSRAIGAGRYDLVREGIQALAGENSQLATNLANNYQFHSRNAGRADLGGVWDANAKVAPDQLANERQKVILDGLGRTDMPSVVRGHTKQVTEAANTIKTMLDNGNAEDRTLAATRLLELHNALPYATGENQKVINDLKSSLGLDPNQDIAQQLVYGLQHGRPGQANPRVTAQQLQNQARVYDARTAEVGGQGPGASGE